ncbi:MAG: pilus assembly protein TadG [Phenylobacterium sp.]|uniref:TadE/TadG family type IV pilus assembly protein n=1 Tax=Phenylobacterium sp. TaxID=1871053 RepID=UPI0025DA017D|nr:TadE/TadG family type IV pilus assembly protein [Phenylobacterium sp.]MBA4012691.1 pilus assembly protein TadG [Phenylobacterium sp.]
MTGRLKARCVAGIRDERGATAVFFAVGLLLLAPATMGLIDLYMITTQRGQLQDALDTATLYVARSTATSATDIQNSGDAALRANLKLPKGQEITSSTFKLAEDKITIKGRATITPPTVGPRLWVQADIAADSEVLRNSNNVEVALVLDTTGSMEDYMENLKTAAKDLIDLVVKDQQKPYYTKVAIVPYSVGVNMGTYEAAARGAVKGTTAITGATKANPVMITSANHGLYEGERLYISGVSGMAALNDKTFIATAVTKDTFKLQRLKDQKIENVDGTNYADYVSGGTVQCKGEGCSQNIFTNASSTSRNVYETTFSKTACATERTGDHAYDDAAPSGAPVGWHYAASCPSKPIVPLSTNKTTLKGVIDSLVHSGSTAGHIGLAWGWYMISPEWKGTGLWTDDSAPAAYGEKQLLKVVVLMTDGAFNTPYCRGVAAKNSGDGAPNADKRINCDAVNGDPFAQAAKLCTNMKAKGVIVYTVGFNVGSETAVKNLMNNCATAPEYVYMPNGGAELRVAFRAIAQDINSLRIAK